MNDLAIQDLLDKVTQRWPACDPEAWRSALAPLDFHKVRETFNACAAEGREPTLEDLHGLDPNRMTVEEQQLGLERIASLRRQMGWPERKVNA